MDQEIISIADKVIELLKQRKIMEMPDLVRETGAHESDIKLIIGLLEKEEMVEVEYSLTKVLVSWNDEADRLLMKMKKDQKISPWDPSKHVSKTAKREQHTRFLTPLKPVRERRHSEPRQQEPEMNEAIAFSEESDFPKFAIFDGSTDGRKIEKQIKDIQAKMGSRERSRDIRSTLQFSSYDPRQAEKAKQKPQKPSGQRTSTFNAGAFAVKLPESDESESEDEPQARGKSPDAKESRAEFDKFNSKTENILGSKQKGQHAVSKSSQKGQVKARKDKEIDREVKEIEKTILLRLGDPARQDGESYEIIDFKESDIVNKVKKDLERKPRGNQAGRTVLNSYKAESNEPPASSSHSIVHSAPIQSDGDMFARLREKLTEIVNKKSEILELNKEKTVLFDDPHLALKSKLMTEVSALGDLVENRETKIKELQGKISDLPNGLKTLESDVHSLRQAQLELNERFSLSMDQIRGLRSQAKETREDGLKELMLLKRQLSAQEEELQKMGDIYKSFKSNEEQLTGSIGYVRNRIRGSQMELINLEKELEDVQFNSDSIRQRIEEIGKTLRQANSQFDKSMAKLQNLDEFEFSISAIEESYGSLKSNMSSRLDRYEKEMVALKESIQFDFTKKYLQEIERLTLQNENEFKSLLISEERIDGQIEAKKRELSSLIEQAKSLQAAVSRSDPTKLDLGSGYARIKDSSPSISAIPAGKPEIFSEFERLTLDSGEFSHNEEKRPGLVGKLDQFFTDLTKRIK